MKATVKCPKCRIEQTVKLKSTENPIFADFYLDNYWNCPNCDIELQLVLTATTKDMELPF